MEQLNINDKKDEIATTKKRTEGARLTASTGQSIKQTTNKIGGEFTPCENPEYIARRQAVYDRIMSKQKELIASFERKRMKITLPDGTVKEGTAWETTPLEIARNISPGLADTVVVARVRYSSNVVDPLDTSAADVDGNEVMAEAGCSSAGGVQPILWDLTRPLVGDCKLELLKFDDPDGKMVFWHSSAHVLGECLECSKGVHLTIGPPVEGGFYYDCYMGDQTVPESDFKDLVDRSSKISKDKQSFERIVLTKQEALELFADNPFKVQLIQAKIPENGRTSAYRCGPLIDLCRGPHIPHTGKIKALAVTRTSSAYWLGKVGNDSLQRVYGISFPDKQQMKEWKTLQEEAAKRDHRKLGLSSELFFFHHLSPGSCFWLPHGAHLFFKLLELIREQYRLRGYQEVITPNLFNMELWNISGHAQHYKENMFCMKVEEQEFALKPMNCPSHCLMFDHRLRSYRELPLRIADCGVLHRNEFSGALSGLTRVRRFQQDDSHIFCREDQIESEILGYLDFLKYIYGLFNLSFSLELSTRPEKALGEQELWDKAESQLAAALNKFAGKGSWRENPGDGAFYGPKIDVIVTDALKRQHQCATVQLDFQLPIRFDLKYKCDNEKFERPVMVHRAIYGSFERFIAILTEHYAGKFPFWISPRQALVVAIGQTFNDYGQQVKEELYTAGFNVDFDDSSKTLNKKIREGQMALYNYILVVGAKEMETHSVNIRTRDNQIHGTKTVKEVIEMFTKLSKERSNE